MSNTNTPTGITRIAWVTGGTGDIGRAIVSKLQKDGLDVTALSSSIFDIGNENEVRDFISNQQKQNFPDVLICNAGINSPQSIEKQTDQNLIKVIETNALGHIRLIKSVIPYMTARKFGRVVMISSRYSQKARIGRSAYSLSKSILDSFMRSVAVEYASEGVLANSVAPGFIDTALTNRNNSKNVISKLVSQIPLQRLGTPQEVGDLVSYLCSESNTYITGQVINIDGGLSLL